MLTGRKFHMLRDSFDEGLSISEIARQTGYDCKTIRKYINSETPPMRNRRSRDPGKIAPFKEYIIRRLYVFRSILSFLKVPSKFI